jgi:D-arginine dehydrogenase
MDNILDDTGADYIIIGGGIAGASIAYWLAPFGSVIVLERESQPGYHSTGRSSAALYMESYGPPQVRALTAASRCFFDHPPAGFSEHPLLTPRGAMTFALTGQAAQLNTHEALVRSVSCNVERLDADEACRRVPVLRRSEVLGAVYEADAADIDVDALHHGFLRGMRAAGGTVICDAEVLTLTRPGDTWEVGTTRGCYRAPVLINAAGAWADVIGKMAGADPIGLVPKRRSAFIFQPPAGIDTSRWPLLMCVDESFYIKPEAGMLLGSPANADPVEPQDVQAEELDIAIAIDRIESITTLSVRRPSHAWAGLRSFVADGEFVGGFDPRVPGLFWAAAQGGYGIQTAPAAGQAYAALLRGIQLPARIVDFGVDAAAFSPARFA